MNRVLGGSQLGRAIAVSAALAMVMFNVWLVPACASRCAADSETSHEPGHCHSEAEPGDRHTSHDHDCQKVLCSHLQTATQATRGELLGPDRGHELVVHSQSAPPSLSSLVILRRSLPEMDVGPPLPSSPFTILRS